MKVSSTYLEYLLKQKQVQKLESQVEELETQIRDLKGDLQRLERSHSSATFKEGTDAAILKPQADDREQVQPWGEYILLILVTSLVIGMSLAM